MDSVSLSFSALSRYWSGPELAVNATVLLNLLGALLLGLFVGYERAYNGRAAGMRTYGLVCMASCAITVIAGYPGHWYGGAHLIFGSPAVDPTRVIQGVVTGIGFLGAGVIMRDGFSISGLTTAASIWASSSIGIMVGVGFYAAAIMLALLCAGCMVFVSKIENLLPMRQALSIVILFKKGVVPDEAIVRKIARKKGYEIVQGTVSINCKDGKLEWRFVAIANKKIENGSLSSLSSYLCGRSNKIEEFHLTHARN